MNSASSILDTSIANPLEGKNLLNAAESIFSASNLDTDRKAPLVQEVQQGASPNPNLISLLSAEQDAIVSNPNGNTPTIQPFNLNPGIGLAQPDLVAEFGRIFLPQTIEFGDNGTARVKITNNGNAVARGPIAIQLWSSTDKNIDINDVLLTSKTRNINLNPGQTVTLAINYENNTSAVAPGAYNLIAKIDTTNKILESNENNNVVSKLVSAPGTDVVIDWNATALNAIQAEGVAGRGIAPTVGSRLLAILSTSVYNTVNAFNQTHEFYGTNQNINAPGNASLQAAAAGAAYRVLTQLIPQQASLFSEQLIKSLGEIKDNPISETMGVIFGQSIADQILALRANDGFNDNTPYTPPTGDYVWRPEVPGGTAVGPNWGKVTPWGISSIADFAPDGLDGTPTNDPVLYAQEIEEVRRFGGRSNTSATTIERNADQTELSYFWAYDRADTFRPYGQLNQIAQEIAVREGTSLAENARLFAALNVALADSVIVAWDAKYKYTQPRPDDVIAGGIAENDGLASTIGDPNWQPLLPTPPFPDYISGHSVMGGAFAGVLTSFFGENYQFSAVSQELPGVIRNFNSFYEAGVEDAESRIYGGVHVREASVTDAVPTGFNIGEFIAGNFFQPVA